MTDDTCSRCKATRPPLREGRVFQALLRRTTTRHGLRFQMWRLTPWTENPGDQVRMTYTDLDLCSDCAKDVFLFAQGREIDNA